jgi:Calx-beta domain
VLLLEEPIVAEVQTTEPVADEAISTEPAEEMTEPEVPILEEAVTQAVIDEQSLEPDEPVAVPKPEVIEEPLVDFSTLPPPTTTVQIAENDGNPESVTIRLRENGRTATVDLLRQSVDFPLTLRLEEVGFSGNRSPWMSGQYEFSDNGFVEFPVGQDRARITLAMIPDFTREADQQVTLRVRQADLATSELAVINVVLEDDDQRAFEATLPANTVAFATSQVTVNEQDPAVQLDVLRFNPDSTSLVVGFRLRDITATEGQDYFEPGGSTISFGPGQRVARLLVPLVQDSEYEDNEAFSVELSIADSSASVNVYHRVAILIRDDDQ